MRLKRSMGLLGCYTNQLASVVVKVLPRHQWTNQYKTKVQMNAKANYLLTCALSKSEYDKIISCDLAKEIWDRVQTFHEGTNQVKETKISMLVYQCEMLNMLEYENIDDMLCIS